MGEGSTVVFVHGAWHGAWCWEKVAPVLEDAGHHVVTFDLPLTSFHDDVDATTSAIDAVEGPVVLCGHSYGGAVITQAGHHRSVEHLVYITAFACDEGESPAMVAPDANVPATDLGDALQIDGGQTTLTRAGAIHGLYHDCDDADVEAALARLRPMRIECITTPLGPPAWAVKPSTYAVCANDQGVHPDLQRLMAARCTNRVEWPTAHSPFLNRPDLVAGLLAEIAK